MLLWMFEDTPWVFELVWSESGVKSIKTGGLADCFSMGVLM
jgi:hypothetical protein